MNTDQYRQIHGPALAEFFDTTPGKQFLNTLSLLRPSSVAGADATQHSNQLGQISGFERALNGAILLSTPLAKRERAEPDYGVSAKPATPATT